MILRTLQGNPWKITFTHALELLDVAQVLETFFWMVLTHGRPGTGLEHLTIIAPGRFHRVRVGISNPTPLSPHMRACVEHQVRLQNLLTFSSLEAFLQAKAPWCSQRRNCVEWEHTVPMVSPFQSLPPLIRLEPNLLAFLEALLDPDKQCEHGCEVCQGQAFNASWTWPSPRD